MKGQVQRGLYCAETFLTAQMLLSPFHSGGNRLRGVKWLVQGYTVSKLGSWDLNLAVCFKAPIAFYQSCCLQGHCE